MAKQGWVKLYRKITDSLVWSDPSLLKMWILCLTKANHDSGTFNFNGKKILLNSGQFVTGRTAISDEFNYGSQKRHQISAVSAWRLLRKLESMEMLYIKTTTKYSVVTVLRWVDYQEIEQQPDIKPTTTRQQPDTNKNDKNEENEKKSTIYSPVVDYLNQKAGTKYKSSGKKTQSLINSRVKDGFKLDDFKKVIDNKTAEWQGTDMEQYLRPETLFGTKFEGYLNQKPVKPKQRQNFTQNNDQYSNLGW